ncbi:hypothetical protein HaLaN_08921 [Haematococcus lacustris]|uniref:Uncharacterized protein n=1 Tax=Haematococcus lacustris TaxID=44745 RepID=A0A699Z0H3_HAELA|nr:hypothetical protein HaLaN_08921 [Haematococcus lacustris]
MRLYGAQEKVLERYFKKLEEAAAMVSQQWWGTRMQLVVPAARWWRGPTAASQQTGCQAGW